MPAQSKDGEDESPRATSEDLCSPCEKPDSAALLDLELVKAGGYVFLWMVGLRAAILLLEEYANVFKPLVVAALTVSILEFMVQVVEWLLWKSSVLVCLFIKKTFVFVLFVQLWAVIVALHAFECCGMSQRHVALDRWTRLDAFEHVVKRLKDRCWQALKDWDPLKDKWQANFAGRNTIFRFIGIGASIFCLSSVFSYLGVLLSADISDFAAHHRVEAYEQEVSILLQNIKSWLLHFPDNDWLPISNHTRADMKQWITGALNSSNDELKQVTQVGPMLNELMEIVKSALSQTSGFVTQLVFYALYCIMWLMDPVHVNTHHLREKYASKIFGPLWVFPYLGRRNDMLIEVEDKREFEREVFRHKEADQRKDTQEKIYGILRTYFFLKNVMNGLFAVLNWMLFTYLRLDLAKIMAALCFLLSFIPELGAMVAFVVPLPICLMMPENCTVYDSEYDCQYDKYCGWNTTQSACRELPHNGRMSKAASFFWLLSGMLIIKFAVGNILESIVMGRDRTLMGAVSKQDDLKETHPVVIIFAVVFFGEIWGPLGMLICVPIISILRLTFNFWKYKFDPTS